MAIHRESSSVLNWSNFNSVNTAPGAEGYWLTSAKSERTQLLTALGLSLEEASVKQATGDLATWEWSIFDRLVKIQSDIERMEGERRRAPNVVEYEVDDDVDDVILDDYAL